MDCMKRMAWHGGAWHGTAWTAWHGGNAFGTFGMAVDCRRLTIAGGFVSGGIPVGGQPVNLVYEAFRRQSRAILFGAGHGMAPHSFRIRSLCPKHDRPTSR